MGFSLELFFDDLRAIAEDDSITDEERLERYEIVIKEGEEYARQCGLIE
jgi:hypothetical protein